MTLDHYDYQISENFFAYEFYSEGPNGIIKKNILFTPVNASASSIYNLSFGDIDEDGNLNDLIISNNHDAEKVLATVAQSIILFSQKYPDALIYAEGSTPSRTRRYQMGINKFWKHIEPEFYVFGLIQNQGFEPFRPGINYNAFAVKRKMRSFM